MPVLLSPVTSANIWIQSRMQQARQWARAQELEVSEPAFLLPPELPPMQQLLAAPKLPAGELNLSASKEELGALPATLAPVNVQLASVDRGNRRTKGGRNLIGLSARLCGQPATQLNDGIYICSPAVSTLAVAQQLKRPVLAQLLTELSGKYALDPAIKQGFGKCPPLLMPQELAELLAQFHHTAGVVPMRRALPYVATGSESPRETIMQLLLSLPTVDGGTKLPVGEFGHEVPLGAKARKIYGRKSCRCDLYYPQAQLTLEYESDQEHAGDANRKKDSRRFKALELEGIGVMTITSQELESIGHMNVIASMVAERLGKRLRVRVKNYPLLQLELFDALLARKSWRF